MSVFVGLLDALRGRPGRHLPLRPSRVARTIDGHNIGRWTYGDLRLHGWGENARLRIGGFCSLANGVQIFLGGNHRTDWVTTFPFPVFWAAARDVEGHPTTKGDVEIGNDVWIGAEAMILSGVRIGDGAVIGAGSVVAADVPPYAIAAGNPARTVRFRFDPETIAQLVQVRWWDWDEERIARALPLMLNHDISKFLGSARMAEESDARHSRH
jgi:acetyltransferase-like isoleucine patch superfamily enzyme